MVKTDRAAVATGRSSVALPKGFTRPVRTRAASSAAVLR